MAIFKDLSTKLNSPTAVALGFFDGVHIGHASVIKSTVNEKTNGLEPTVFTFYNHPSELFKTETMPLIMMPDNKATYMLQMGVKNVFMVDFLEVMQLSPYEFVEEVLVKTLRAKVVYCGFNYTFGRGASGNVNILRDLCSVFNIKVVVCNPVMLEGRTVSSTKIRECLSKGNVIEASRMLGRPFSFNFEVGEGKKLGRQMGTPTINQYPPKSYIQVRSGVYASVAFVDGVWHTAVTNYGVNPTVGADRPRFETWIHDYSGDLYGKKVTVCLVNFIRKDIKFNSITELMGQIMLDGQKAKQTSELFLKTEDMKKFIIL